MADGTSLAVQWLGLRASSAGGTGAIPGWGTKIPHAMGRGHKNKVKWLMFLSASELDGADRMERKRGFSNPGLSPDSSVALSRLLTFSEPWLSHL